jgi:hypothetical protein
MRIPSLLLTDETADMRWKRVLVTIRGHNDCSGGWRALQGTVFPSPPSQLVQSHTEPTHFSVGK